MKFAAFHLMPVAIEALSASMCEDSDGGKKITANECKSFGKLLDGRMFDIESVLEFDGR